MKKTNGNFKTVEEPIFDGFKRKTKIIPLIPIGGKIKEMSIKQRFVYFWKLASSLNEAAQQIQKERDELNKLLFQKEEQINQLRKQQILDRTMIHKRLSTADIEKQKLLEENQSLYIEIKRLKEKLSFAEFNPTEIEK